MSASYLTKRSADLRMPNILFDDGAYMLRMMDAEERLHNLPIAVMCRRRLDSSARVGTAGDCNHLCSNFFLFFRRNHVRDHQITIVDIEIDLGLVQRLGHLDFGTHFHPVYVRCFH